MMMIGLYVILNLTVVGNAANFTLVLKIDKELTYDMFGCCSSVTRKQIHCIVRELHSLTSKHGNSFFDGFSLHHHKFYCRIRTVPNHSKRLDELIRKRINIFKTTEIFLNVMFYKSMSVLE